MFERALTGSRTYWGWITILSILVLLGLFFYLDQLKEGLGITGMGRNVSWGLYIANFTFLVGVAASAVMVVLPYYLHNYKVFGRVTLFGEFLAVPVVLMSILFIFVDLGQPARVFNVFRYPSPRSVLFWDMIVLTGYLILNLVIGWRTLEAERRSEEPPSWLKPLVILSIPWAISIHTVTAFIYSGLGARPFWLTGLLAPRFLASAFASGPAILILLCLLIKKVARFEVGTQAIQKIARIVTYALAVQMFFLLAEFFTVFYAGAPEHLLHFRYLLFGLEGQTFVAAPAWISFFLACAAFVLLVNPSTRGNTGTLVVALIAVIVCVWVEKGLGFVVPGFVPAPLGEISQYRPTVPEVLISLGVWAVGGLVLTVLYKIALSVREEV